MKVLVITNLYPPYTLGGAEKYVYEIVNELKKKDEVMVLTTVPKGGFNIEKEGDILSFYPLNLYHTYYAKNIPELVKPLWHSIDLWNPHSHFIIKNVLKEYQPDVVFTHNFGNLSSSIFSAISDFGIRHVHMLHDHFLLCPRATLFKRKGEQCRNPSPFCVVYRKIRRKFMSPDAVVAPSLDAIKRHVENGFFRNSELYHLPLPVKKAFRVKKKYSEFEVVYAGGVSVQKGFYHLIKSLKGIRDLTVHVAGSGIGHFSTDNVIFHGHLNAAELKKLYIRSNVLVVPSVCLEVSPKVIYEAFSYSTPVVASRIGGIPEIVIEGRNGILFEPENLNRLREAILYLKDNPDVLKKLECGAYKTAKRLMMDQHLKKLRKILKGA